MLDQFLVLGLIPGTSIELNLFEIILLPLLGYWLQRNHNYSKVYQQASYLSKNAVQSGTFRSFVIWAYMAVDKPRGFGLRQRLSR